MHIDAMCKKIYKNDSGVPMELTDNNSHVRQYRSGKVRLKHYIVL